jgi:hypothetical protein
LSNGFAFSEELKNLLKSELATEWLELFLFNAFDKIVEEKDCCDLLKRFKE